MKLNMPQSRARNVIDAQNDHIRTLRIFVIALLAIAVALWWGWRSAPSRIRVDIPPDIRSGSTQRINDRLPTTIYAFAYYLFQQLNRWPKNGDVDYGQRIDQLQHYLTSSCRENRLEDFRSKRDRNELRDRIRYVSEIPGRGYSEQRVFIQSDDSWVVYLDLQVMETLRGERVKDAYVRFPLRVVRYEIDRESNPFGLALDCFSEEPQRLELERAATPPAKAAAP